MGHPILKNGNVCSLIITIRTSEGLSRAPLSKKKSGLQRASEPSEVKYDVSSATCSFGPGTSSPDVHQHTDSMKGHRKVELVTLWILRFPLGWACNAAATCGIQSNPPKRALQRSMIVGHYWTQSSKTSFLWSHCIWLAVISFGTSAPSTGD